MAKHELALETARLLASLGADTAIGQHVDPTLACPEPYWGAGQIRVVVLGQDPTIRNSARRRLVRTVLNLDRPDGSLSRYLRTIAEGIGTSLAEGVYGTNVVKNFFVAPPTTLDPAVLSGAARLWRPLLLRELEAFPRIPIIALGEPVLRLLVTGDAPRKVRDYWGFRGYGKPANPDAFRALLPRENDLGRLVFPMPHQPSLRKQFYAQGLLAYLNFIRENMSERVA